jgi:uncharacterized membrane protein (UPF0127 family)
MKSFGRQATMAGQALVIIKDKQWVLDIANTSWELMQGLGGISELPAGTGMLFDLSYEKTIEVTTIPMLLPLDIAFLSDDMTITEIYRNVQPGYLITSQLLARYFIEVNTGEFADMEVGEAVSIKLLASEDTAPVASDLVSIVVSFILFLLVSGFCTLVLRNAVKELISNENTG